MADPSPELYEQALKPQLQHLVHMVGGGVIPTDEVAPHLLACALRTERLLERQNELLAELIEASKPRPPGRPRGSTKTKPGDK